MNKIPKSSFWVLLNNKLYLLISLVVLIGIILRFINLDYKVYWHDETYTSLRISGYTQEEVVGEVYQKNIVSVQELEKYQKVTPEKNVQDTLNSLALEDAMHPPLYFVSIRYWSQIFNGNSIFYNRFFQLFLAYYVCQ